MPDHPDEIWLCVSVNDLDVVQQCLMNAGPWRVVDPIIHKLMNQANARLQPPAPGTPADPPGAASAGASPAEGTAPV